MKTVKLPTLATAVAITICIGCTKNTDAPAPQEWAFNMEKTWEINQAGEDKLLRPGEPRIADDGTLYYRDFDRDLSYIISDDGKLISTFAPRGGGEGEISYYFNCFPAGDGVAICAPDKIHFFTNRGQFVKAVPNNLFARFPLAFKNQNEFWLAPGALGDAAGDMVAVTYVNAATGAERIIHEFSRSDEEKKPTGGGVIVGLTPQIKMGFDGKSNRIYFGKNSDTLIYSLTDDISKIDSFSFTGTRRPVSETDKKNHFARFNVPEERMAMLLGALPDRMACYHRIQAVNGLIYLFSAEGIGENQTGQDVNIYSPDGRQLYYGRIKVENGWHISGPESVQLGHGFVYAIQENATGDKKIVKYKLTLP
jgi:hypothetical protein